MCSGEVINKYKDAGEGEATYGMSHVALILYFAKSFKSRAVPKVAPNISREISVRLAAWPSYMSIHPLTASTSIP
jgi:hypothetical protein